MNRQFKVLWTRDGRRVFKTCEDVATAKEFRKKLRTDGVEGNIYLISKAKAYAPQPHSGPKPKDHMWCPYCVAWRVFKLMSFKSKEFPTPSEEVMCSVCLMPVSNYWVQYYNDLNRDQLRTLQRMVEDDDRKAPVRRVRSSGRANSSRTGRQASCR